MSSPTPRGNKHICASCQTRFYDLNKSLVACPACNHRVAIVKPAARRPRRRMSDSQDNEQSYAAHHMVIAEKVRAPIKRR
jgi:uncharacterized protein (TIGR02300 family)